MPRFENPSVAGPEFRDKRKRGRPKCERRRSKRKRGRYVNEAAQRFGNLCVYETSALRKKPSDSSEITSQFLEEAFRFLEEAFRFAAESPSNAFQKGVPNRGINFKNAYRKNSLLALNFFIFPVLSSFQPPNFTQVPLQPSPAHS